MTTKEKSVKLILDDMYKAGELSDDQYTNLYKEYTTKPGLSLTVREQSDRTDSKSLNQCILESAMDIASVFDSLNTADDTITRHQKLNEAILNSIKLENNKLADKITEYEYRIKNANRFVRYEAFRDISGIEQSESVYFDQTMVHFDKYTEAVKLHYSSSTNMLVSKTGARLGNIEITRQHGSSMTSIKNAETSIENAVDTDMATYWHECITVDSPIEIEYDDIKRGAVCELLITFNLISEINEITLTPFGEFPLEVVKISVSDDDYGDFTDIVFSGNNNTYLRSKASKYTMSYQFADTKVKRVKLLLNQRHYVYNNFIGKMDNLKANGIFITDNKEALAKEVLKPVEGAIAQGTFAMPVQKESFHTDKLQYEYGLYNILLAKNEYSRRSLLMTTASILPKAAIMILNTEEEHFIDGDVIATSIEYELVGSAVPGQAGYPILPHGTTEVKWEFLDPIHDFSVNKMKGYLRFPAEISSIKVYCDDVQMSNDFIINSDTEIEFVEFNPHASYCVSYKLRNPEAATECHLANDGFVRVNAVLRQNSRRHTGVTPILYNYTLMASNMLLQPGEENGLAWIGIIPDNITIGLDYSIPLDNTELPILVSITPNTPSVYTNNSNSIDIDEYSGYMEDDR